MNTSNFSLEFELTVSEIRKLNKMYFKNLYQERVMIISCIILLLLIFFDFFNLNDDNDLMEWIIRSLVLIAFFMMVQYSFVNTVCKILFRITKKLLEFDGFISKYKFNFTNSFIYVHSPLGEYAHKWSQIEKAILTKDFFFLYIKERNGYIISISNKCSDSRNMEKLIAFIENNVTQITKV
jgi:hypothetical protein